MKDWGMSSLGAEGMDLNPCMTSCNMERTRLGNRIRLLLAGSVNMGRWPSKITKLHLHRTELQGTTENALTFLWHHSAIEISVVSVGYLSSTDLLSISRVHPNHSPHVARTVRLPTCTSNIHKLGFVASLSTDIEATTSSDHACTVNVPRKKGINLGSIAPNYSLRTRACVK
ncbi:hypothetical protein CPB85DRAFT_346209 [Mucidula mucida]|nr:hypothetical protein CPB85DRAFT_346209 [Mucidula mucida]